MMRLSPLLRGVAVALAFAGPVVAHEIVVGDIEIIHPYIPQPPATAKAAGGYMAIANNGSQPDRLIGIETEFAAKAALHESKVDPNGMGTMEMVEALDIPAGETVSLEQGGLHIMLMGLKEPLLEGEMHKATLIFERAGRVEIAFMIDPPAGKAGMDHAKMGHGSGG